MAIAANEVWGYIIPLIGTLVYSVLGIGTVLGVWYYLFVIKRRRYWFVDVYEQNSTGKLYLVQKDRLQEKKINYGKQTIYVFRKTKTESIPPPYECVRRLGNKEYCDYIRIQGEYIPLTRKEIDFPDFSDTTVKDNIFNVIAKKLRIIRGIPTTRRDVSNIEKKFVYIPIHKALRYDVDYQPISYDVNMMRINEIDSLDQMFKNKKDFWEKYGTFVIIGAGIVMVIVIAWFGFEYAQQVVQASLGSADRVARPLESIAERLGGSSTPAS